MVKRFVILFTFSLFISTISNLYAIPQQSGSLAKIVKKKAKADTSAKSQKGSLKSITEKNLQTKKQPSLQQSIKPKKLAEKSNTLQIPKTEPEKSSNLLYIIIGALVFVVILLVLRKGGKEVTSTSGQSDAAIDENSSVEDTEPETSNDESGIDTEADNGSDTAEIEEQNRLAEEKAEQEKDVMENIEARVEIDDDEFTGKRKITMKLNDFIGDQLSDKYNENWPYGIWMFLLVKVDKIYTLHAIVTASDWWFVDEKNSLSIITDKMETISLSTIRNDRDTISSGIQEYMIYEITEEQLMAIRDTDGVVKARIVCNNHGNNFDNFWNYPNPETLDDETITKLGLHSYYTDYSIDEIGGPTSLVTIQDCIRYFLDHHGESSLRNEDEEE